MPKTKLNSRLIQLQERDVRILNYLRVRHFATADQIRNEFWAGKNARCNHYRRMSRLIALGFAQKLIGDNGGTLGYALSPKGIRFLRDQGTEVDESQTRRILYRSTFQHDKALNDLRSVFESSSVVTDFLSEKQVRCLLAKRHGIQEKRDEYYKVPDGLFKIKTKTKLFQAALELEMTLKSKSRYLKIFRQLSTNRDFQIIFVVGRDASTRTKLENLLNEVRRTDPWVKAHPVKPSFYFATLDAVLRDRLNAQFQGEGEIFSLSSLTATERSEVPMGMISLISG